MTEEYRIEIGALLRRQRESLRLSKEEVSQVLHIRVRYLSALEEGALGELPGLAYTKGYLHRYAGYLGLDASELLRRFEQVAELLPRRSFYFPEVFSKERKPARWALWGGAGLALLIYLVWYIAVKPKEYSISPVEPLPVLVQIPVEITQNVACLQPQLHVYPPCTTIDVMTAVTAGMISLSPLPIRLLHGPIDSVMELANY